MKTEIITVTDVNTQADEIRRAAQYLKNGALVAIPTETVYGLAADALNPNAVQKIFEAKGRPQDNPLIVHIAELDEIYQIAQNIPPKAIELAKRYWPGPLTIILPKKDIIPVEVSAGLSTVAVRMPSNPIAHAIIKAAGTPLAAPSANISGFPSPTAFSYVYDDMNERIACMVNGGDCEFGIESTVVTLATPVPRLLRPGAVTPEQLRQVLGEVEIDSAVLNPLAKNAVAASPGMKYKHYAPKAELSMVKGTLSDFVTYVNAHQNDADYILCFEGEEAKMPLPTVTMGKANDSLSQAKRLFDALRELDGLGAKKVLVRSPNPNGVGLGVCNRLYRACAFRFLNDLLPGKIIGIAGNSGSGKSTVCEMLMNENTVLVDADKIAREIMEPGGEVLTKLVSLFGETILNPNGSLNRSMLASLAFENKAKTLLLNAVTGPAIIKRMTEQARNASLQGKTVLLDAPLLFSAGLNHICNFTVKITAPKEIRKQRLRSRDSISEEELEKRLNAQATEDKLSEKADIIINNYPPYQLEEEIKRITEVLL